MPVDHSVSYIAIAALVFIVVSLVAVFRWSTVAGLLLFVPLLFIGSWFAYYSTEDLELQQANHRFNSRSSTSSDGHSHSSSVEATVKVSSSRGKAEPASKSEIDLSSHDATVAEKPETAAPTPPAENPNTPPPKPAPEWVTTPTPDNVETRHLRVSSDRFATEAECERQLDRKLTAAVSQFIEDNWRNSPQVLSMLDAEFVRNELKIDRYAHTVQTSVGPMVQVDAQITIDAQARQKLNDLAQRAVVQERVSGVAIGAGAVLGALGLVYGILRASRPKA